MSEILATARAVQTHVTDSPWTSAAAAAFVVLLVSFLARPRTPAVRARAFLTGNESEFLGRLERALPELRVHCQVSMGALLRPSVAEGGPRRRRGYHAAVRARFDRKVVDYVLQSRSDGKVVAVVELDDRTHVPSKDRARDAMMARAGYRTIRWHSRRKPDEAEIRRAVLGASVVPEAATPRPKGRRP